MTSPIVPAYLTRNYYLTMAVLFFLGISMLAAIWMVFFPPVPFRVVGNPVILPGVSRPGGVIAYSISYCKDFDLKATLHVTILKATPDEPVVLVPVIETAGGLPVGCHTANVYLHVPIATPPGRYSLLIEHEYAWNGLLMRRVRYCTPAFEVIR